MSKHDDCCGGSKKVEIDVCDLILCGAKLGKMACKCKKCCPGVQASGSATQVLDGPDIPNVVKLDSIDLINDVEPVGDGGFKVGCDGIYFVMASPQVGSDPQGPARDFRCWVRVNGVDVPNSNVLLNLLPNGQTKDVIITQGALALNKDDVVEIMAATSAGATGPGQVFLEAIQPSDSEPLVPSCIFTLVWECPLPKRPRPHHD